MAARRLKAGAVRRGKTERRVFARPVLGAVEASKALGIRAGGGDHRIIGVWAVVVEDRVFVRSWDGKRGGWWATFLDDPEGVMEVAGRRHRVRAVVTRSARLRRAVSRAFGEKYPTPGARKYVRGFATAKREARTLELRPR